MSNAFNWLTPDQRDRIVWMEFKLDNNQIKASLIQYTGCQNICYESVNGATNVKFTSEGVTNVKNNEIVEKNFVDVFCEDIKLILMNQRSGLKFFYVEHIYEKAEEAPYSRNLERMYEGISNALKWKQNRLETAGLSLTLYNVQLAMSVIRQFDPNKLCAIVLGFPQEDCTIIFDDLLELVTWSKKRLHLCLITKIVSLENFESINNLLKQTSTFSDIDVTCGVVYPKKLIKKFHVRPHKKKEDGRIVLKFHLEEDKRISGAVNLFECKLNIRNKEWERILKDPYIMEYVLKNLQFFDIQSLRRVSYGVRNVIDDIHPDPHIKVYKISTEGLISGNKVFITVEQDEAGGFDGVTFSARHGKCKINKREVGDYDFRKIAILNFEVHTKDQKNEIELNLFFNSDGFMQTAARFSDPAITQFWAMMKNSLEKRHLKVWKLVLRNPTQGDILQVLSCIDDADLRTIEINGPKTRKNILELDEVVLLRQWRNAETVMSNTLPIATPIRNLNIQNFSNVDILVTTISPEDILHLKNELLRSSTFQRFKITFQRSTLDENLHGLIGEPYRTIPSRKKVWYFRMPNTDFYLQIVLDIHNVDDEESGVNLRVMHLVRVEQEDTPFF